MAISPQARKMAGCLFAGAALLEFAVSAWVLVFGPFDLRPNGVPVRALDASKGVVVGVLLVSLAVLILEAGWKPVERTRLAHVCARAAFAAVLLSLVPLAAPIFLPGFLSGHDGGVHQTYTFLFNRALEQGQLPVRWVEGIGDGLGQPLFNFYQVGFYYLVTLIHRCGPSLSLALKMTIAGQWAVGGVFMFFLCKPLGMLPAAMGAAVFIWSPYLLLDAYVRTAYPELTAIGFAPGVLWSLDRVLSTRRPIFVCTLAVTTALLLISHLPTAVIIVPVATAYLVGSWIVHRRPADAVGLAVVGAVMGAGMAAFYLLPALIELDAIKASGLTAGYLDYHRHFVRPVWWFDWRSWGYGGSGEGAADQLSLQIGIMQWIVLAAALVLLIVPSIRRQAATSPTAVLGWLSVVGAALFMMTAASSPVWETFSPLTFVQFPWRMLMLATLACAVLSAIVLSAVRHPTMQALVVVCAVVFQWYLTLPYRDIAWTRTRATITIDDPAWASTDSAKVWAYREPAYDPISTGNRVHSTAGRWRMIEGYGKASALSATDTRLRLEVHAPGPLTLVIHSSFVVGWRISVDGETVSPLIEPGSGYMRVRVPVGVHAVDAVFGNSEVRTIANVATVVSVIGCLAFACTELRDRSRGRPA